MFQNTQQQLMHEGSQNRSYGPTILVSKSQRAPLQVQGAAFDIKQEEFSHADPTMMPIIEYRNCVYSGSIDKRNQPHGLGMLVYDSGEIIVSRFCIGKIQGYFLYYANLSTSSKSNDNFSNWMWLYGKLENLNLEGQAYVADRFHRAAEGQFCQGRLKLHEKKNRKIASQKTSQIMTPIRFLKQNLSESSSGCINLPQIKQTYLSVYELENGQLYYGTVRNEKPHGYGLVFMNQKLLCHGTFINGCLNGHGRVYQSSNIILDGIFINNLMKEGWVVDTKNNETYFGVANGNVFEYKQQYKGQQLPRVIKYRKRFHLQSLHFTNTHFTQNFAWLIDSFHDLVEVLPNYDNESLTDEESIIPSFISQISRVNPRSPHHQSKGLAQSVTNLRFSGKTKQQQKQLIQLIQGYQAERKNYQVLSHALTNKSKQKQTKPITADNHSTTTKNQRILFQRKSIQKGKSRSKSKSPNIHSAEHSIIDVSKSKDKQAQINNKNTSMQTGKQVKMNGRISEINKIAGSDEYSLDIARSSKSKWTQASRQNQPNNWTKNSEKGLNLHELYSKYLRKDPSMSI